METKRGGGVEVDANRPREPTDEFQLRSFDLVVLSHVCGQLPPRSQTGRAAPISTV
jgi:hypothetical protein